MPITVNWGNAQKTIVHTVFEETWTLEEAHSMIDDMYKLATSVDQTVHTVLDFSKSRSSPAKLMSTGRHINNRVIPNGGISVIIKANGFVKAMVQVIMRMSPMGAQVLHFADSPEEAYQIVEKYEQTHVKG